MKHLLSLERLDVGRTLALTVGSPSAHRRGTMLKHIAFMLLFMLGSLNVWGETDTYDFKTNGITKSSGPNAGAMTQSSANVVFVSKDNSGNTNTTDSWTIQFLGSTSYSYGKNTGVQFGGNASQVAYAPNAKMTSKSYTNVSQVQLITSTSNSSVSVSITVGGANFDSKTISTGNTQTQTFTKATPATGAIAITVSSSTKTAVKIEKIIITTTSGSNNPTLSLKQGDDAVTSLDLAATDVENQSITLVPANFSSNISSVTTGLYSNEGCTSAITSGAWVKNITVNAGKTAVTFNVDDNEYGQRQCWLKITASDGSKNAYAVLPITQAKYTEPTGTFSLYSGALTEGDYVITYSDKAMNTTFDKSYRLGYTEVTPSNNKLSNPASELVWHIAPSGNYWTIYSNDEEKYLAGTGAKTALALVASGDGDTHDNMWTASGTYDFTNVRNTAASVNATLRENTTFGFGTYSTQTGGALTLYKKDPTTATLTFDLNGKTLNGSSAAKPTDVTNLPLNSEYSLSTLNSVALKSDGYHFLGWNTSASATAAQASITPSVAQTYTLYAIWVETNKITSSVNLTGAGTVTMKNGNATITSNSTLVDKGTTVTLTKTENTGFQFLNWTVKDANQQTITVTNNTFTMPATAATVVANYKKLVQSITVKNGDDNVSGQTLVMTIGDEINLTVDFTPSDATTKTLTWTSGDDTKVSVSNGTLTAHAATTENVTITVTPADNATPVEFYVKVNAPVGNVVTLSQPVLGGTVDASPKGEVDEDTEVTLSYSALSTHEFVEWIVKDEDDNDVTVTNNKFKMPDKSVTVTASFRPKAPVFTPVAGEYEGNQVVTLTSFDGDHFYYYYTLNGDDPDDNSTPYNDNTNGITLTESATLKMIVFDAEIQQSTIASATYTITHTPASLTLSENGNEVTFDDGDDHYLNDVISLPDDVDDAHKIQGKVFKGWSSVQITTPVDTKPSANFFEPGADYTLSTTAPKLYAVYATENEGAETWTETAISDLAASDVVVIVGNNGDAYAMTNDNGTGSAPSAGEVTVSGSNLNGTIAANVRWNISKNGSNYTIYPNGTTETWLYCTNTNNGVRVGTNTNKIFTVNEGYLYNTGTSRYVGIYNSEDWRCYTGNTGNIDGQTFKYYKRGVGPSTYNAYTTSVASYDVTAAVCENGSVSASVAKATENATVTITATPSAGYALLSFDVYKTGESTTKVDFTVDPDNYKQATFSMPAYAVTVSATFIKVGTAENPLTVAELIASQANLDGYYVYAQGVVSQLGSLSSGKYTYFFSGDGTTTNQFQVYNGYKGSYEEGGKWYYEAFTSADELAVGDEVIVEGYIDYYTDGDTYQFESKNNELTYHCRPVVVTKGTESNGTFTITANEETITDSKKYCLADLSGENDLTVTVVASPASGYRLKSITSAVGTVGTISNNTCTITGIKASTTINATFEQVFAVALAVNTTGTLHGDYTATINGAAGPVSVAAGETINLAASVASEDDEFVNWTATEGITITSATALSTTATTTQAGTITANFRPLADPHTITNGGINAAYGTIVMKDMEDNVVTSLNLRPDKTGKLVATEEDGYRFTGWTVTPANAVTFADATAMETTFAAKDVAATISATYEARTAFTVKFMNGNTQIGTDATVYDGRTIDLLGAQTSFDANHTRFCGWVKNSFEGIADAEPSFVSGAQTIDGNTTFYAVYGNAVETNNYGKITESAELESGNYLIAAPYSTSIYAMQGVGKEAANYHMKATAVTPVNDVIANPDANLIWDLDVANTGVSFYTAQQSKYLYTYKSNSFKDLGFQDNARRFTCAADNGVWSVSDAEDENHYYLSWDNSNTRFEAAGSAYNLYLYKQLYESDEWVSLPVEYVSVTFDKHAGSETVTNMPANITNQMKGYSLTEPSETPERAGYNFIGWNTDDEATEPMSFPQTINTNTTVYAIWQAYPDCAIDLYVNGVKDDDISTSVKQGAELDLSAIDAPERLGYDFLGWAANPRPEENTTAIDIVDAYTPTPNVDTQKSFYAVYTRQEGVARYEKVTTDLGTAWAGDYLIAYDAETFADGRTGGESGIGASGVSVNPGEYLSNNVVAASWGNTYKVTLEEIATNSNTYLLKTKDGNYNYKTDNNNGITTNTNRATADDYPLTIAFISASDISIANASGAVFHYNTSSNGFFRFYKNGGQNAVSLYKYIAGTTYYTTNPAVNYNVSYNLAGGAWKEDEGCESAIVAANDSYDVCEDVPVKTDYIFTGWTVGGEAIGASITVTETTEIVANYRVAETYNVYYDANGALGTAPAATPVKEGASYTVLGNTWFFKAGYSFAGWNTSADGTGTKYAKDAIMTMPSENVTLYAQWSNSLSERDVVIVAHYGNDYYAMGQTLNSSKQLNAVQVQMLNGKVRDVAEENRAAITWHMIVNSSNNTVSFYNPNNKKYLGYSGNDLAYVDEAEWTWDETKKCYKIGTEGGRTFWYRNSDANSTYNCFKYYSTGNVGGSGYASEMILAYGFAVTIDGDATESAITVGDDVVVTEDAKLTINNERVLNSLTVEAGGTVSGSATLIVKDVIIESKSGATNAASGQIIDASKLDVNGDLFMDITLFTSAEGLIDADYWYSVAVPFDVDINSGIYKLVGTTATQLHNSADFDVWYYDTEYRASSKRTGWKRLNGKMEAGKAYLIGFDDGMSNKVRFKAAEGWKDNLYTANSIPLAQFSDGGDGTHSNWNGIANPTMHYIGTTADVQVFDNDNHTYSQFTNYNYVVGTAFFVKATSESFAIGDVDANNEFRAPKRESENKYEFSVRICKGEAERFDNQMYVRASEEASAEFDANRDITSMNSATAPSAMLWTENYGGKRLAIEDAPIVNNTASYVLGLYAPKAGQYRIEATDSYGNADLYLTYEGSIIWNLSMGAYEIELAKGATNGYGLLLQAKAPQVVTGVDEVDAEAGVQKIIIDEHVFILRGGQMYDVTGKTVK